MLEHSARNRLHVSLSELRAIGLGDLLQREGARYRLDPSHAVVISEEE
jgi:hypothetical protein